MGPVMTLALSFSFLSGAVSTLMWIAVHRETYRCQQYVWVQDRCQQYVWVQCNTVPIRMYGCDGFLCLYREDLWMLVSTGCVPYTRSCPSTDPVAFEKGNAYHGDGSVSQTIVSMAGAFDSLIRSLRVCSDHQLLGAPYIAAGSCKHLHNHTDNPACSYSNETRD
jgi:hypothetical protein